MTKFEQAIKVMQTTQKYIEVCDNANHFWYILDLLKEELQAKYDQGEIQGADNI